MASIDLEYNSGFQIYNSDGTPFHDLVLHKCTYETVVMSLGDKISGILYYKDNALDVTMSEYIIYKGVRYTLVNPPTILREGLVSDNSELRGMTKYSFTFYHQMYVLNNFPFSDIAVQSGQSRYLSQNKTFSWIGTLVDFVAKLNKNLEDTQWMVTIGNVTQEEQTKLSEVLSFDKNTIAEALKRGYETWEVPYVVDQLTTSSPYYPEKRFVVQYGLPTTEILDEYNQPFVFQMGQGVGLKNNSRTPRNNKIITRIAGYGSEDNIPYGYPQIPYYGGDVEYPLYYGIVGGQRVQLIKHPFTRNHLMPSVYSQSVYNKVNPKLSDGSNNPNYDPNIELVDYYDANDNTYTNRIKPNSPSYEIHEFGDIKPELGEKSIISAVPVSQQETQPDYKQKSDFLQEILDRISATEIEDEKTELLDVYDRVDAGLSYYKKHGEEGGDTYWFVFSITRDNYYEYVSYESSNYNFTATVLRNGSSAPTPDWDDTMDDDGNYLQSYFKITLPILEFDLYACAAITQEMKINMRSGACIGCTFPVEVDWDDYKRNFYNSDGEFDPDGEQRDYTKYPDSSSGQITVMVKKELETFGTLMPNQYQQPTTGDKFVILGISLPNTYITSAEQRLDTDMKQYMRDNNVYYYDYPLKFDEHFLISHEDILSQMKNNVVVRFNYAGTEHALYIKQMSVKYNESPLPKYDITLTDDIEIVLNQIGQVTDEVSKLRLGFGAGGFGTIGAEYIRKDIDDTARGTIRMIKGMQVGERFVTGLLGEGGVFRKDSDGTTYLETDKLYVRMKAYFDTVEVKHYLHTGGNRIASQASGIVCSRVEMIDAHNNLAMDVADAVLFRCFFKANDGDKTIRNDFMIGDLAFCRETNVDVSSVNLHGYWRLVIGRNSNGSLTENKEGWIDLSNRASETLTIGGVDYVCNGYQNGSDAPIAQDDIIQLGNIADKDRQGAIVEYVGGEDAPSYQIFQGIGEDLPYPYTLEDKNYINIGYSSQTGRAYMNVYGDFFFGAKEDPTTHESPTYIKYDSENEEMTIKAVVEFQNPDDPTQTTTLDDFASAVVSDISNIQSQIDGEIDTWFYEGTPALNNLPASNWATDTEKDKHLGDLYYDIGSGATAGFAYRFIKTTVDNVTTYSWQYIDDTAITEALRQAAKAQDTADNKRRVFVAQPVATSHDDGNYVEYDVGDLWANATGTFTYVDDGQTKTVTYDNDLLRCRVSKPIRNASGVVIDGTFSITDWELATRYTDDTKIDAFLDGYQGTLTTIRNQVDKKAETYYQDDDPSTNQWGSEHVGDMWFCTSNHTAPSLFQKGTTWIWQEVNGNYVWSQAEIPQIVFDTLDGKKAVYVAWDTWYITNEYGQSVSNLALRDLLIPATDITPQGSSITYYANRIYRCTNLNPITFQEVSYVDEQAWSNWIQNTYNSDMSSIEGQIDHKAETWYQNTNPENSWDDEKSHHVGDLWLVNIDVTGSQIYKAGTTWYYKDNGVGADPRYTWEKQVVPQEVFDYADGKAAIFVGSTLPTNYHVNDMWFIGDGVADANLPTGCIAGDVVVSSTESTTYNKSHWAKKDRYTDDSKFNGYITQIINGTSDTSDSAQVAQALHVIKAALNENTSIDGGLILTSLISLRSNNQVWAGISGLYDATKLGSGIASWYGGLMKDYEALTDAQKNQGWSVQKWAKSLFRFDGSGYLADGNITWDANGIVNIANVYADVNGVSTSLSGSLQTLTNLSNALPLTLRSGVTYLDPQYGFSQISITHDSNYVISNNSVLNYGEMKARFVPLEFFNALFTAYSDANHTNAINPWTWTDTAAASRAAINNLKILVGAWTDQYLSAKGLNSSGGSGGVGDVTWDLLANSSDTRPIALSHLTTALSSYATQSWVSSQGYLTSIPTASSSTKGGVKVGNTLAISSEVLNLASVIITAPATGDTTYTKVYVDGYGRVTKATTLSATDIPSLAASKITSGEFDAARIPNLSWTKITTDKPTTLSGYGITDGVKNDTTWWGRSISGGAVKGSIEKATSLEFDNIGSSANNGGYIDFHYNGDNTSNSGDYTSRIIEDQSGIIKINNTLFAKLSGGVTIGTSTVGSNYKLEVSGEIGLTGSTKRIYFSDMNHYIELDSNGYFHFSHGLYSDSFVSAKGLNSNSGSSITLNEPLNGINNAGLSAPTSSASGQTVVWNGSAWTYSINTTLRAGAIATTGGASIYGNVESSVGDFIASAGDFVASAGHGFKVTGGSNDEVLLANGTKITLKTVNGYSLFGSGNIDASGGGTGNYLPLAGGTMEGNITMNTYSIIFTQNNSSWNLGANSGLRILNSIGTLQTGAPTPYSTGLSVSGYYAFQLAVHSGNNERLKVRMVRREVYDLPWKELAYTSDITDALSSYLPLSGGTLTDRLYAPYYFLNKDAEGIYLNGAQICWHNSSNAYVASLMDFNSSYNVGIGGYGDTTHKLKVHGKILATTDVIAEQHIAIGYAISSYAETRAELDIISSTDQVAEIWLGNNQTRNWCLSSRNSSDDNNLNLYRNNGSTMVDQLRIDKSTGLLYNFGDIENSGNISSTGYIKTSYFSHGHRNAPQFIFDKAGSNYTGIGANDEADTIFFGAVNGSDFTWVTSYKQKWKFNGRVSADTIIKHDGTSSQFLKADGSVDSNTYALSSSIPTTLDQIADGTTRKLANYLPLSGGDMTGAIRWGEFKNSSGAWDVYNANFGLAIFNATNTGAGSPSPYSTALHVSSTYWFQLAINRSKETLSFRGGNSGGVTTGGWKDVLLLDSNGNTSGITSIDSLLYFDTTNSRIGIGTSSPTQKLDVNGDVKATNFRGNLIGNADTATTASKLSTVSQTLWGNTYWTSGGVPTSIGTSTSSANLSYVGSISMNSTITGCTSIDSLLYFDTTNSRIGVGVSAPDYGIDAIGGMRLRNSTSGTGSFNCGVFSDSNNPYIRMTDLNGSSVDIKIATVTSQGNTTYPLSIGDIYRQTRIIGQNVRIYSRVDASSTQQTPAIITTYGGRVIIGSDTTLHTNNADCRMSVSGSLCTAEDDGTFIKIGQIYIGYDSSNTALKVYKKDSNNNIIAANFYATGAVSAWGANTSSGGSGIYVPITGDTAMTGDLYPNTTNRTVLLGRNTNTGRWSTIFGVIGNFSSSVSAASLSLSGGASISGNVGIGISSDNNYLLKVQGTSYVAKLLVNSTSYTTGHNLYVVGTSYLDGNTTVTGNLTVSGTVTMCSSKVTASATTVSYSGKTFNVIKFAAASSYGFYLAGTPCFGGAGWTNISDIRKKIVMRNVGASIGQIANAPVFDFKWKEQTYNMEMLGSSAQYWQTVFPNAIKEFEGTLTMDYSATALAAAVVTARTVQNHEARIRLLEVENEALRNEINKLKNAA